MNAGGRERVTAEKVLALMFLLLTASLRAQAAQADTSENGVSVTYRPQENTYFCGPAVVQMALSYLLHEFPSQDQLATEMETDPVEGLTYTDMMQIPFKNRGFTEVYEGVFELEDLKEASDSGFLTIILVYFSRTVEFQHYVLVVGYNDSGIHIHDPWPTTWSQPEDRRTGANAFVSNDLLTDLWDCEPSNWGLTIPYSTESRTTYWWQQYWYLLVAVPISAVAILAIIRIKKKQPVAESPSGNLSDHDATKHAPSSIERLRRE